MIAWCLEKIKKLRNRKEFVRRDDVMTSLAFTIGGVDYYEVADMFTLPFERGKAAVMIYEELKMKCDFEYLQMHVKAIDNIFTGSKKLGFEEMRKIKTYNDFLKERLDLATDPDLIYKIASVVFFDKNESPIKYDAAYCKQKIELWKKHEDVNAFFLREPLIRLIPYLNTSGADFQTYGQIVSKIKEFQWQKVFGDLSTEQQNNITVNN